MASHLQAVVATMDTYMDKLANLADNPTINYQGFVQWSSWAIAAFEVLLIRRQLACYSKPLPPPELASHLSSETFKKAQAYGKDKARFSLNKALFNQLVSFGMIYIGLYSKSWDWAGNLMNKFGFSPDYTITQSLIWVSLLTIISSIPALPWSYYYTFVIEERHGFNKSTKKLFFMDELKKWGLGAVLGLPILAGFLKVIEMAGRNFVPWLMLFMITLVITLQLVYPTFIQPLFNKLEPLPTGDLRTRVESLATKLGFPLKHLYVIDGSKRSSHSNAYFYGLPWSKHIVIYDTLMEKSSAAEVEAVLAHELGHWYFSHPTKLLLIGQFHLLFTFTIFHMFIHNKSLYSSFHFNPSLANTGINGGPQPILIGFMLFQMVLEPLDTVVKFLMNAQTRKYEYQADEFGVELNKKNELKSSLIKLHIDNLSSPHNDPYYSMYHHSHPTLPERLRAMDQYKPTGHYKLKGDVTEKKEL